MQGRKVMPVGDFKVSGAVVVAAVVALFLVLVGGAVFISNDDVGTARFGLIIALMGPIAMILINLLRSDQAAHSTEVARSNTDQLLNGRMDAKIREGVAQVLEDKGITSAARAVTRTIGTPED